MHEVRPHRSAAGEANEAGTRVYLRANDRRETHHALLEGDDANLNFRRVGNDDGGPKGSEVVGQVQVQYKTDDVGKATRYTHEFLQYFTASR